MELLSQFCNESLKMGVVLNQFWPKAFSCPFSYPLNKSEIELCSHVDDEFLHLRLMHCAYHTEFVNFTNFRDLEIALNLGEIDTALGSYDFNEDHFRNFSSSFPFGQTTWTIIMSPSSVGAEVERNRSTS